MSIAGANFAERLKNARPRGVSQEKAAAHVGVSSRTIIHWEAGDTEPTVSDAVKLAELYRVDLAELLGRE